MKTEDKNKIVEQCKEILSKYCIDISKFTFRVDEVDDRWFYVAVRRNGKSFFEINTLTDDELTIIQYQVNFS